MSEIHFDTWKKFISSESKKPYYKKLTESVLEDSKINTVYPKHKDLFSAFDLCPLEETKVVIVGMDPYHGENQAHGLAFSVMPEVPIPPSLRNIYKEINLSFDRDHKFSNGCLTGWAKQGVLLINSIMTVRKGEAGSHKDYGWQKFTDNAIKLVNSLDRPIVFMLWGSFAKSKKELITNPTHLVLESVHPSPLSAYNGFFSCGHFVKANEFLLDNELNPVDWFSNYDSGARKLQCFSLEMNCVC